MKKVAFYTLGCKLNYSETSTISRLFETNGFQKVKFEEVADIYVINTCSVTENADKKCRKVVKEALKFSPNAFIAIIGCYAQLKPKEISEIPGVDAVLGASEKFRLIELLGTFEKPSKAVIHSTDISEAKDYYCSYSLNDRTRTFLKVQDGCDYSCSFCTIPLARGSSRSDTSENILEKLREISQKSEVKEIVLTGVNIGDYGIIDGVKSDNFYNLTQKLDKAGNGKRFRISSIEPNLLTDEIIEFVAQSKNFTPHFHIPLQSGSDKILKFMRRRYQRALYVDRVNTIKKLMPHCCIGVDVIVGFPGETEEDFLETYNFLNELDISYLHVFSYSERANTKALEFKPVVPMTVRQERSKMLRILSDKKRRFFYEQHLGKTCKVLFEDDVENGQMHGFTENYIRVAVKYDPVLINEFVDLKLAKVNDNGVMEAEEVIETLVH
ncbi:MAG TPA: tRNA (N(6)-L-threonylcarbamoyladenosine(37)-C(2))-methylthiotransferase MtaB [Cytophagaceae bacterium]|jgi:threonylcarbamoyladenosine tRNA methylthiotransferase MtaB